MATTTVNENNAAILVTGATGTVGREVVRQLVAAGRRVRALVRDEATAAATLGGPGVELAVGDLDRPDTLDAAVQGVERLYLLTPMAPRLRERDAAGVDAAKRAGVPRIVKHSNLGAEDAAASRLQQWHRAGEKLIEDSGLAWTFVRPSGFMSNALGWAGTIKSQGAVYGTGADGRLSVVDPRDIAAVAVAALTEPGHEGKAYDVTGPQALTNAEQVAIIAEAIGTPIRYVDLPEAAARQAMLDRGMPVEIVDGLLEFVADVRQGGGEQFSDAVQAVTGRPARTFAAWVADNASAFR